MAETPKGFVPDSTSETPEGFVPDVVVKAHTRSQPGFLKRLAQQQSKNLPAYGAMIGGALGAPALAAAQPEIPVGLAMLGAGTGKALEQALAGPLGLEPPKSLAQAYIDQGNTAAAQGLLEAVPAAALTAGAKVAKAFAKSQMSKALRPAISTVKNFPKVVQNAIEQRATVGDVGLAKADVVRRDATGKVVGLLRAATRKGKAIDIEQVADPVIAQIEQKAGKLTLAERAAVIQNVQDRADQLLLESVMGATHRSSKLMSPMMADELRKAAARAASATLRRENQMGFPENAIPDIDRLIARGSSAAVKRLAGVRAARAIEQRAIGVEQAVREATLRPNPAPVGVGLGPVKMGIGIPPQAASQVALGANDIAGALQNPLTSTIITNFLRTLLQSPQAFSQ